MRFSIVIPVYNSDPYIGQCLDSIISQSFTDFEILCIDDGSEDNSVNVLKSYAARDSRILLLTNTSRGVSSARNLGIREASGDYILFADADDWMNAGSLDRLNRVISDAECDMVYFNFTHYYDRTGKCVGNDFPFDSSFDSGWSFYEMCAGSLWFGPVWRMAIRSNCVRDWNLAFNESISHFEDMMFTIDACYNARQVVAIPDTLYVYRRRQAGGLMSSNIDERHRDMVTFANDLSSRYIFVWDLDKSTLYRTIAAYYRNCLCWSSRELRKELRSKINWSYFRSVSSISIKSLCVYYLLRCLPFVVVPILSIRSLAKASAANSI